MEQFCRQCKFSVIKTYSNGNKYLECRKHPPRYVASLERWPIVLRDDWCGQFEREESLIPEPPKEFIGNKDTNTRYFIEKINDDNQEYDDAYESLESLKRDFTKRATHDNDQIIVYEYVIQHVKVDEHVLTR